MLQMVSHHMDDIGNRYKHVLCVEIRAATTGLSQSMNKSGIRTCYNSVFIAITAVSSAKDIILCRSEQIGVYMYFDVSH